MSEFERSPNPSNKREDSPLDEMMALQQELEDLLHSLSVNEMRELRVPIDVLTIRALLSHDLETFRQLKEMTKETIQRIKNRPKK